MSAAVAEDQRGSYFSMQHTPSTQKQFAAAGEDETPTARESNQREGCCFFELQYHLYCIKT
jgi:hypothetical protein